MNKEDYILSTVDTLKKTNTNISIKLQININFEQIKANLEKGMKITQIHQALTYEKKINCSYRGFANALKKIINIEYSLKNNFTSKEKEEPANKNNQESTQNKKLSFDQIRKERQLKVASLNQPQMKQRTIEDVENNINDLL